MTRSRVACCCSLVMVMVMVTVKNSCPSAYGVCMLVVVPGAAIAQSTFCFDPRPALMMTMQKLKPSRVPPLRNNTMLTTGIDKSTSLSTFIFTTQQTPFFYSHIHIKLHIQNQRMGHNEKKTILQSLGRVYWFNLVN